MAAGAEGMGATDIEWTAQTVRITFPDETKYDAGPSRGPSVPGLGLRARPPGGTMHRGPSALPGGDALGSRPMAMTQQAEAAWEPSAISSMGASCPPDHLAGAKFSGVPLGRSHRNHILMAAVSAEGVTTIHNRRASRRVDLNDVEPDCFLNFQGAGRRCRFRRWTIYGVQRLYPTDIAC